MSTQKKNNIFIKSGLILFSYMLLVFGNSFNLGFYFVPGLAFILIAFFLLLFFYNGKVFESFGNFAKSGNFSLVLILFVTLSMSMYGGMYQQNIYNLQQISRYLLMFAIGLSYFYLLDFSKVLPFLNKYKFYILIFIAFLIRIFILFSSPRPLIDVFDIQQAAPRVLISGQNPYSVSFKTWEGIDYDVFTYGPAVVLLDLPAVLLLNDPRFTMVFAEMGTAFLLFLILKKKNTLFPVAEIIPLIFLYQPRAVFTIEQAWVDPLLVFILTIFVYLLYFRKRLILSSIILGLSLSIKQYSILLLPFLLKSRWYNFKQLIISFASAAIIVVPFMVWNFKDFVNDVILFNLKIAPRYDSNSLNSLLHRSLNVDIPPYFIILLVLILFVLLLKRLIDRPYLIFLAGAILTLGVFLLYKLAFLHYYYYAGSLILLSLALLISKENFLKEEKK